MPVELTRLGVERAQPPGASGTGTLEVELGPARWVALGELAGPGVALAGLWAVLLAEYGEDRTVRFELDGVAVTADAGFDRTLPAVLADLPRPAGLTLAGPALTLRVGLVPELPVTARFDRARLAPADVSQVLRHLGQLVDAAAGLPAGAPLAALSPLTPAERETLLRGAEPPPGPSVVDTVPDRVRAWAARTPDAVAVVGAARRLTYAELVAAADRVAAGLRARGERRGDLVPVAVRPGPDAVVALLGVLAAGAGYVPVEEHWPAARTRRVLDALGADDVAPLEPADGPPGPGPGPDDPAYVLFTSGSTGTPKGVRVGHRAMTHLLDWANDTFGIGPADRSLLVTPLGFDLSVWSLWGPLVAGGSVRVAEPDELAEPARLRALLATEPVTVWNSAPAALEQLEPLPPGAGSLRLVLLSGDRVPVRLPDAARAAFPAARVVALGGPTETTVWSNWYAVGRVEPWWSGIPYGWPIRDTRRYVLDERLRPRPGGVPGRLFVAGVCLADGYLDPAQTAARFRPDPFAGGLMYDTGDRVRLGPDGCMEFVGRTDGQVKVRGFRIELGELEAVLAARPGVRRAVAAVVGDRLLAYAVPVAGERPDPGALRAALAAELPAYAVPAAVLLLDRVPVTANGKVDRAALPAPAAAPGGAAPVAPGRAPAGNGAEGNGAEGNGAEGNGVAGTVAAVWSEVLGVPSVEAGDSFTELGGHSLAATRVIARLKVLLEVDVPLRSLVTAPDFAAFAAAVGDVVHAGGRG